MTITVRYWAAAMAAAGVENEEYPPGSLSFVLAAAQAAHPDLTRVLAVASVLVDGVPARPEVEVPAGATVEILPPFAGG